MIRKLLEWADRHPGLAAFMIAVVVFALPMAVLLCLYLKWIMRPFEF
jgi:hypothetical protein